MTGIDSYSTTPATNATADGGAINWAEGQPPSSVNNTARQMLADIRTSNNDLIWFQYGTGDQGAGNIAVPSVYLSSTSFTITGANVTAIYEANRRVRAVGVSTGTIYGSIASSSYNSGNTKTTVTVVWDSGSLANETLTISLSQIPITGNPSLIPFRQTLTASNTVDMVFTTFPATYNRFRFTCQNIEVVASSAGFGIQVSLDGGSMWKTANYQFTGATTQGASLTAQGTSVSAQLSLTMGVAMLGNAAINTLMSTVEMSNPATTGVYKWFTWASTFINGGGLVYGFGGGACIDTGTDVNPITAVRFLASTGNIASGTVTIEGFY